MISLMKKSRKLQNLHQLRDLYLSKDQLSHARTDNVYRYFLKEKKNDIKTGADQDNLAQLYSGHHKSMKTYANRLDDEVDQTCPDCGEQPQDLKHCTRKMQGSANNHTEATNVWKRDGE